jgi:high affinity Mn2+ porin
MREIVRVTQVEGKGRVNGWRIRPDLAAVAIALSAPICALADEPAAIPPPQDFAFHAQATVTEQGNLAFTSPYSGANSLPGKAEGRETVDLTAFVGLRPWANGEVWFNPEFDQGFGLRNTLGVAGFPSGEAYKVGRTRPYFRLQRLFLRQTINLSGDAAKVDPDLNQLGGVQTANRVVLTIGRFGVTDVFDTNAYAHDPKHDFLNWALIDAGTFDYAADAWGYTVGASVEWYQGPWTLRAGLFDLSKVPNSGKLDPRFGQFQVIGEGERRYKISGKDGAIKLTGYLTRGRMARFADAIALGQALGEAPDVSQVRQYRSRTGVSVNLQQQVAGDLGVFARAGWSGGDVEPYEFSDIDRTVSGGVSLTGKRWGRPSDTLALAAVVNEISKVHQAYLAAGGLGILVGDGRLPHPGSEDILETFYNIGLTHFLQLTLDYQFVDHPAYNTDRGPVSILAARLHAQF